jgi:hypothetical protein
MKLSRIIRGIPALIALCLMVSCSEEIDLKLDNEQYSKLIVEGCIRDDVDEQRIQLKKTAPYDHNEPCPPATGAIVEVFDGQHHYLFSEVTPGIYTAKNMKGESGKKYTLTIHYKDQEYSAVTEMKRGFPIDSIGIGKFHYGAPADLPHYQLRVYGQEDSEPYQFYIFQYAQNDRWNDTLMTWSFLNDLACNGTYLKGVPINVLGTYDDEFEVQVRAIGVEQNYLHFIDQCIFNYMPNMFFSPPPATVTGNISNGGLGYFYAASVTTSEKRVVRKSQFFTE